MKEIHCLDLKVQLEKKAIKLIDVREDYEVDICQIQGSINIPMNSIPGRIHQLDIEQKYAVICHSGVRSRHVCEYLNRQGFSVKNVVGGIDMWATVCDESMKRY